MRAQTQSLGPIILDDLAAHRHGRECDGGLMSFGAELAIAIIGGGKERERFVAQAFDRPGRLAPRKTEATKSIRARDAVQRGHRHVGAAPEVLDGGVGARSRGRRRSARHLSWSGRAPCRSQGAPRGSCLASVSSVQSHVD